MEKIKENNMDKYMYCSDCMWNVLHYAYLNNNKAQGLLWIWRVMKSIEHV